MHSNATVAAATTTDTLTVHNEPSQATTVATPPLAHIPYEPQTTQAFHIIRELRSRFGIPAGVWLRLVVAGRYGGVSVPASGVVGEYVVDGREGVWVEGLHEHGHIIDNEREGEEKDEGGGSTKPRVRYTQVQLGYEPQRDDREEGREGEDETWGFAKGRQKKRKRKKRKYDDWVGEEEGEWMDGDWDGRRALVCYDDLLDDEYGNGNNQVWQDSQHDNTATEPCPDPQQASSLFTWVPLTPSILGALRPHATLKYHLYRLSSTYEPELSPPILSKFLDYATDTGLVTCIPFMDARVERCDERFGIDLGSEEKGEERDSMGVVKRDERVVLGLAELVDASVVREHVEAAESENR